MNPFRSHIQEHVLDNTSSIYSRSPDTAKDAIPTSIIPYVLPIQTSFPEINTLDHHIGLAGGSTMGLELTRSRLELSKRQRKSSLTAIKERLQQQLGAQERENEFYRECFQNLHRLAASTMESTQGLALQYHFNPGNGPSRDPRLIRAIVLLRTALDKSHFDEGESESEWKRRWDLPSAQSAQSTAIRWI